MVGQPGVLSAPTARSAQPASKGGSSPVAERRWTDHKNQPAEADSTPGLAIAAAAGASAIGRVAVLRLKAAAAAGALLVLLGAVLTQPVLAVFAKALADPFFHSTSAGAAAALLALATLCALGLVWRPLPGSRRSTAIAAMLFVAGVAVGNAANLAAHLQLISQQGLPWTMATYQWAGDTNTYSYVLHAHAGKVALHTLLGGAAAPWASGFDIGTGLATQVSPLWGLLCLGGLLAAVAGCTGLLPAVLARWPGWPLLLLWTFCAFNAIKTTVDGGPLTYRFAPVAAVLMLMLPALLRWPLPHRWAAAALAATLLLASAVLSAALAGPLAGEALQGVLTTGAVIGLLAAAGWRPASAALQRVRAWGGVLSGAVVASGLGLALLATPTAMFLPLPADTLAHVCDSSGGGCAVRDVGGQRAFDVYRQAGDDPLKPRHTLLGAAHASGPSRLWLAVQPLRMQATAPPSGVADLRAVSAQPLRALPGGAGVLVEARASTLPSIFDATPGPFSAANFYVFLHQAAAALRAQGLVDFGMSPLRTAADARALGLALEDDRLP